MIVLIVTFVAALWLSSGKAPLTILDVPNEPDFKPQHNLRESLPEIVACLRANKQ